MDGAQTQPHSPLGELHSFIESLFSQHPGCSKDRVSKAVAQRFNLVKQRSVYSGEHFSVRFSTASGKSFSNVVISLSTLRKYDHLPFVVCIVRPNGVELLLANTTFLKKVSHSSHQLRVDNIRGSILGHDIVRTYDAQANAPSSFDFLFSLHQEFTWEENLTRLVEATNAIAATGVRYEPNEEQVQAILKAPELAQSVLASADFAKAEHELTEAVLKNHAAILKAASVDNVNLRGNQIEQIITAGGNLHELQDLTKTLSSGVKIIVDIKTKLIGLASNPKCYNVDKTLIELASGDTVFCLFLVGIDRNQESILTRLVSILDVTILGATRIQFHWAGRNSRGVTQLTGDFHSVFEEGYEQHVDVSRAVEFLRELIDIRPATS